MFGKKVRIFSNNVYLVEIKEKILLLDWLVENYKKFGAEIQIATDISHEGSQLCRGFGGIGGNYI